MDKDPCYCNDEKAKRKTAKHQYRQCTCHTRVYEDGSGHCPRHCYFGKARYDRDR